MKVQLTKISAAVFVLLFLALMVPIMTSTQSAAAQSSAPLSLTADGSSLLSVVSSTTAAAAAGTEQLSTSLIDYTTTLGAPATTPVALGDDACSSAAIFSFGCDAANTLVDTVATVASCSLVGLIIFSVQGCVDAVGKVVGDLVTLALWPLSFSLQQMAISIGSGIRDAALSITNWVLNTELGGNWQGSPNPVLSCKNATSALQANQCSNPNQDAWFKGQFNVMRQIALFLLAPLFMLVVIQSIMRGSMYLLIRSTFVMLPMAIIGSVVVVYFMQLMLNLSDDFVGLIGNYTANISAYDTQLANAMQNMDMSSINWLSVVWLLVALVGAAIIYLELLIRQVGVYMSALFLPLGFAALVWPPAAGFLRKLIELILGLIFSKVFIAAAISLGITALGSADVTGLTTLPGQANSAASTALGSVVSGGLIFIMAAFAGTKVIAMTPAAMSAAEGRVVNPGSVWGKFQLLDPVSGRAAEGANNINRYIASRGGKSFSNSEKPNATTPKAKGGSKSGTAPVPKATK